MIDWTRSMSQTFDFFTVDPITWQNKTQVRTITSCRITSDLESDTLGSASIETTEDLGECYLRVYLKCSQDGVVESFPLGTYLVQSPGGTFDGRNKKYSIEAYTPLIELTEKYPQYGYSAQNGVNILDLAGVLVESHARAPVVRTSHSATLNGNFVAEYDNDTWLTFIKDLLGNAKYHFSLDEMGRIIFEPDQKVSTLKAVYTFNDDNSSLLYPEITQDRDLYGIPNVVEVLCSSGSGYILGVAENTDPNSAVSIPKRGRRIVHRENDPSTLINPSQSQANEYAQKVLEEMSSLECSLNYKHGYCGTRVGQCVRLNYKRAGIENVKAKIVSQTIDCTPGCCVTERAVYSSDYYINS